MEAVLVLLFVLTLIFALAAILGVIKPRWVRQSSRPKAFFIYAIACFVCFMTFGFLASTEDKEKSQPTQTIQPEAEAEAEAEHAADAAKNDAPTVDPTPEKPKNPQLNFDAVINTLKNDFSSKVEYHFGDTFCPQPNYCQAIADGIQIIGMGHIVEAKTSLQESPRTYQTVCAAILSGLSGANPETAWAINKQAFDYAAQNGRADTKLGNVDIKIKPDNSSNLLQCQYVKFIR